MARRPSHAAGQLGEAGVGQTCRRCRHQAAPARAAAARPARRSSSLPALNSTPAARRTWVPAARAISVAVSSSTVLPAPGSPKMSSAAPPDLARLRNAPTAANSPLRPIRPPAVPVCGPSGWPTGTGSDHRQASQFGTIRAPAWGRLGTWPKTGIGSDVDRHQRARTAVSTNASATRIVSLSFRATGHSLRATRPWPLVTPYEHSESRSGTCCLRSYDPVSCSVATETTVWPASGYGAISASVSGSMPASLAASSGISS